MLRLAFALLVLSALPAVAHSGHEHGDVVAGFMHPLSGLDHIAAMLSVGAWSALAGGNRIGAWPLAFVSAMLVGGILGHAGIVLPMVEQSISASLVIIGLLLALAVNAPTLIGAAVIATFAVFHGHAHGTEAEGAEWLPFMTGFVGATALLHVIGIGVALASVRTLNATPVRLIGAATALAGVALLVK